MQHKRGQWWLWVPVCVAGLAVIFALMWKLPSWLYGNLDQASPDARLLAASGFRTALVAGLAGLAALGSLAIASRTYRLTRQGQLTDRYTQAIEQLGSDKLDVRLGGIYALERIAIDSERDHPTIVEVLSAFVREHSHPGDAEESDKRPHLATDVKAALTVLGRLPSLPNVDRADLSSAYLVAADLRGVNLSGFRLVGANLQGAILGVRPVHRGPRRPSAAIGGPPGGGTSGGRTCGSMVAGREPEEGEPVPSARSGCEPAAGKPPGGRSEGMPTLEVPILRARTFPW